MPDKQLDQKKLEKFKEALEAMRYALVHDIKNMDEHNGNGNGENGIGHGMHMADAATDMYDREFSLNLASNDRELLHKIEQALLRLTKGTFGECQHCGCQIPYARLKALPYAETCVKCQEELEKAA